MINNLIRKIERLSDLRTRGILSDEDFAAEKRKLMGDFLGSAPLLPDLTTTFSEYLEEREFAHDKDSDIGDDFDTIKRRWPIWAGAVTAIAVAICAGWFILSPTAVTSSSSKTRATVAAKGLPTSPALLTTNSAFGGERQLERVNEANFSVSDLVPHCTLTDAEGTPIFISAIVNGGERQAIIKRGGKLFLMSIAGRPNRFESHDGTSTVLVRYDEKSVHDQNQDTVKFSGDLQLKLGRNSNSIPFDAACYATHFDEAWEGTALSKGSENISEPFPPLSGKFRNGLYPEHYGTWALAESGCGQMDAPDLILISARKIKATGEDGVLVDASTVNDGVLYTVKFNIGDETWYRQYHIVDEGRDRLWIDSEAFDDPYSDEGTRYSLGRRNYVRCGT